MGVPAKIKRKTTLMRSEYMQISQKWNTGTRFEVLDNKNCLWLSNISALMLDGMRCLLNMNCNTVMCTTLPIGILISN